MVRRLAGGGNAGATGPHGVVSFLGPAYIAGRHFTLTGIENVAGTQGMKRRDEDHEHESWPVACTRYPKR